MFAKVGENIAFLLYGMYNIGKETLWGKKMIYSGIWILCSDGTGA